MQPHERITMKIPSAKVRPTQNNPLETSKEYLWQQMEDEDDDDYIHHLGCQYYRRGSGRHDYWQARRAFLNSYHFSEEDNSSGSSNNNNNGFKLKLKRSIKEINEAAMGAVVDFRQGIMPRRKFAVRVFRIKIVLPSYAVVSMKCFVPWFKKVDMAAQ